jgi:hypothetical protein
MSTLRAAAQQALEALEMLAQPTKTNSETPRYKAHKAAITALRTALAQQDEPKGGGKLPPPLQAEPVEEPVAWRSPNASPPGGFVIFQQYPQALADLGGVIEPLYTHPPRREWQSLSEEESNELSHMMVKGHKSVNWLARAIEAALKEKNA